jgi:hypothetical protein
MTATLGTVTGRNVRSVCGALLFWASHLMARARALVAGPATAAGMTARRHSRAAAHLRHDHASQMWPRLTEHAAPPLRYRPRNPSLGHGPLLTVAVRNTLLEVSITPVGKAVGRSIREMMDGVNAIGGRAKVLGLGQPRRYAGDIRRARTCDCPARQELSLTNLGCAMLCDEDQSSIVGGTQ